MNAEAKGGFALPEEAESRRSVRAVGLLLVFQVALLAGLGLYEFALVDWRRINLQTEPSEQVREAAAFVVFAPAAVLMVLSALGFLFMRRRGWLAAAIAQALCLAACLWLYSLYEPFYVYPIMVYCVLMVLYLNSQGVRTAFRRVAPRRRQMGPRDV